MMARDKNQLKLLQLTWFYLVCGSCRLIRTLLSFLKPMHGESCVPGEKLQRLVSVFEYLSTQGLSQMGLAGLYLPWF